eukprot:TRINITY_DN15585_c1_g2_i1.p1 TRINITY_DN15585_c1_g2~~TRINITY_DN15585_c1_g2_i1.p1  ORF type:complete len:294 (+),score=29.17 TRINITY_DN15585_c1_g2_i1:32-913(+)
MVGQRSCASIIYTMVVANRIAYLSKLLDSGMKFVVSGATNPDQLVQKIKFHVYPAVYVQPQDQLFAAMALDWLRSCEDKCRLADRGHKHSDGHTEVAFYLTLRNRIGADHWRTPGSGEDHGGVLVHDRQSPEGPRGQRKAAREAEREAARKLAMKTHQAREGSQGFEGFEHDGFEEPGTSSLTGSQFASSVMGCPQNRSSEGFGEHRPLYDSVLSIDAILREADDAMREADEVLLSSSKQLRENDVVERETVEASQQRRELAQQQQGPQSKQQPLKPLKSILKKREPTSTGFS